PMKPVGERSSLTWWSRAPTQPNWRVPPPLTRFPWCTPPTEVTRDDDRAVLPVRSPGGDDRVPGVGRVVALGRPGADGGGRRLRGCRGRLVGCASLARGGGSGRGQPQRTGP